MPVHVGPRPHEYSHGLCCFPSNTTVTTALTALTVRTSAQAQLDQVLLGGTDGTGSTFGVVTAEAEAQVQAAGEGNESADERGREYICPYECVQPDKVRGHCTALLVSERSMSLPRFLLRHTRTPLRLSGGADAAPCRDASSFGVATP